MREPRANDAPEARAPLRERVLLAAAELTATRGFEAATYDALCAATGAGRGAVQHHAASRAALARALIVAGEARLRERADEATREGGPRRWRAGAEALLDAATTDPLARAALVLPSSAEFRGDPALVALVEERRAAVLDALGAWLEAEAAARGLALRAPARVLASLFARVLEATAHGPPTGDDERAALYELLASAAAP